MTIRVLMLSKSQAAQYLGCSVTELEKWVRPDKVCGDTDPARRGMRLWTGSTLEAAKSRRKGMRKARALLASPHLPKGVNARAWLPTTVERAKQHISEWRNKDSITKVVRRRRLRIV